MNPADLVATHPLTCERLIGLTKLFDLEHQGGRAESAPQTRSSTIAKATMAEVMAVDSGYGSEREPVPIMPHRLHSVEEFDGLYPPLIAVEAVDDESEEKDALLEEGVTIARGTVDQAYAFGRRRVQRENTAQHRNSGETEQI